MLMDTDVMVDIHRGFPPAVAWLGSLRTAPVALPGLVAMELLQGCLNAADQRRIEAFTGRFTLH
jgi:predicted nucleic acid-binding protein